LIGAADMKALGAVVFLLFGVAACVAPFVLLDYQNTPSDLEIWTCPGFVER
jgi:hypothetical protein